MLNKALLLATILATGCVATATDDTTGMPQDDQARPALAPVATAPADQPATVIKAYAKNETVCDLLPQTGPCSLACDPQALIDQYVVSGTCVTFTCHLTDGQVFNAGGCNW